MEELYKETTTHREDKFETLGKMLEWEVAHGRLPKGDYPYGELFDKLYEQPPEELEIYLRIGKLQEDADKKRRQNSSNR